MSVRDLVEFVQREFPPNESFPDFQETISENLRDQNVYDHLPDLQPIDRPTPPDWLVPHQSVRLPVGAEIKVEGEISIPQLPQKATIDTLAFYLPFHFYYNWGIYLRASGIVSVAAMIAVEASTTINECLLLARDILFQHERFHFLSEVACSRSEVVTEQNLYNPYFLDRVATSLEESLANAQSFRKALRGKPTNFRYAIEQWMLSQGTGYRDFKQWITDSSFSHGCRFATHYMLRPFRSTKGLEPSGFLYSGLNKAVVYTYLIADLPGLFIFKPFPKYAGIRIYVHTRNEHPPPHMHVEIPPGRDFTCLEWPSLKALSGFPSLSGRQRRSLDLYFARYGADIVKKIKKGYV